MNRDRRRLLYEGQVQGVGFRMTSHRLASGFPIAGYVRNLGDGRVELVVEGEPRDVTSYLQAIQREFGEKIEAVQEVEASLTDEPLAGFSIRF